MTAETIMILFALFLLLFWITAKLMLFTPESKARKIRSWMINRAKSITVKANTVDTMINIADKITVSQKTIHKHYSNPLADLQRPSYTTTDEEYINSILTRKGLTTTLSDNTVNAPTLMYKGRKLSPTILSEVDSKWDEVLKRYNSGQKISGIIYNVFDSDGGSRFRRLNDAIRYYLDLQ